MGGLTSTLKRELFQLAPKMVIHSNSPSQQPMATQNETIKAAGQLHLPEGIPRQRLLWFHQLKLRTRYRRSEVIRSSIDFVYQFSHANGCFLVCCHLMYRSWHRNSC